jgi:hypothetical protein
MSNDIHIEKDNIISIAFVLFLPTRTCFIGYINLINLPFENGNIHLFLQKEDLLDMLCIMSICGNKLSLYFW